MKKITATSISVFISSILCLLSLISTGQDTIKMSSPLPDNINRIVTFSCMPCHSSTGGMLSRMKLNFTEWTGYSSETQQKKAAKMYSELKKGKMPPKSVRETRPEIIPTTEQINIIKEWSYSFKTDDN
jgi:hypothetical protein